MTWGNWSLDTTYLTLLHLPTGGEIDLAEIDSSSAMLDWIFEIQGRQWADAKTMHDLLRALDEVLNPAANYCSFGQHHPANGEKLAQEYVDAQTEPVVERVDRGITIYGGEAYSVES